jgi:hypothetical protein
MDAFDRLLSQYKGTSQQPSVGDFVKAWADANFDQLVEAAWLALSQEPGSWLEVGPLKFIPFPTHRDSATRLGRQLHPRHVASGTLSRHRRVE